MDIIFMFGVLGFFISLFTPEKKQTKDKIIQLIEKPSKDNVKSLAKSVVTDWLDDEEELVEDEESYETELRSPMSEVVADEESYETELMTPMSEVVEVEDMYSDDQWESMVHQAATTKKGYQKDRKRTLKKAMIYSEVFGKPKGLE